jgi:5-formyltetrahydrofolate cyclo-ligase
MVKQFCKGQVWTCFNESILTQQTQDQQTRAQAAADALVQGAAETDAAFEARRATAYAAVPGNPPAVTFIPVALRATVKLVSPYKALEKQKRFMRRKMRKPADMKTRMYVNYLYRINFDELPHLPPFAGVVQSLSQDELMDIILFGIPKSWITEMDKQDFDPFSKTIAQVVDFCERMESAENFTPVAMRKQSTGSPAKKTKYHKSQGKTSNGSGDKWCEYHESNTHNTSECTVLNKLKASKNNNSSDKKPAAKKDWKSKSNDAKKFTKKELNAIVKKKVKQAKKEINAVTKRKSDDDDDDSDSVSSLHMLENRMHDIDEKLKHFDFDKATLGKSADC